MKLNLLFLALATLLASSSFAALTDDAPVTVVQASGKQILADRSQMTAYTFDPDTTSDSTCYNGCAKAWPPILLQANENVQAPFGITNRKDGTRQLTYDGHPVYLFVGDQAPGDINGDGDDGIWHIVPVDGN